MVTSNLVAVTGNPTPKIATILELEASMYEVRVPGGSVRISATLRDIEFYAGLQGKRIRFMRKRPSDTDFKYISTATTNGSGEAYVNSAIDEVGVTEFYAEFLGDADFEGCEESIEADSIGMVVIS